MQGARPPSHSQSHTWLLEAQARCYVPQGDAGFLLRCVPSDSPDGNASGGDSALTCCDSDTVVFLHGERHKCHPDQVCQPPPGYLLHASGASKPPSLEIPSVYKDRGNGSACVGQSMALTSPFLTYSPVPPLPVMGLLPPPNDVSRGWGTPMGAAAGPGGGVTS